MILTVTLNLALDVTYEVAELVPHTSHRVTAVHSRGGGKGVNVARVLTSLGEDTLATGLCGGATGAAIEAELTASGIRHDFFHIQAESRRSIAVVAADATLFNEPGPHVTPAEWQAFLPHFTALARQAAVVVLAGSLPPGIPQDAYAALSQAAHTAGARVLLDAEGEALRQALPARPDLVKINTAELAAALDPPTTSIRDAAAHLLSAGARAAVISRGPEGLIAITPAGRWSARPPELIHGNPTGAGDAASAALARTLHQSTRDNPPNDHKPGEPQDDRNPPGTSKPPHDHEPPPHDKPLGASEVPDGNQPLDDGGPQGDGQTLDDRQLPGAGKPVPDREAPPGNEFPGDGEGLPGSGSLPGDGPTPSGGPASGDGPMPGDEPMPGSGPWAGRGCMPRSEGPWGDGGSGGDHGLGWGYGLDVSDRSDLSDELDGSDGLEVGAWVRGIGEAVALSAAAVARPVAGEVDLQLYARLRLMVRVGVLEEEG